MEDLSNTGLKILYEKAKIELCKREYPKRKIVINDSYGGFGLSKEGLEELKKRKGVEKISCREIKRDDIDLVNIVSEMGEKSWGNHSKLEIVEIPDYVDFEIQDYDGIEWIAEKHRKWK